MMQKKFRNWRKGLLFITLLGPWILQAQLVGVWALGDGEKVFKENLSHPSKKGNLIWDGKTIRLTGLYNEVLSFQVILESGSDTVKGIEVAVTRPTHSSGKAIGNSTLEHGPDGYIELFSEHYLRVKKPTPPNWYYGSPASAPANMKGWIPDALIPVNAISGRGGFPLTISPRQNQGIWVDIELPRNQPSYPAGLYKSNVIIYQNGNAYASIPLEVNLLPYYLPDEDASTVWAFSADADSYFPQLSAWEVEKMLKFEAHRHRITLTGGFLPQQVSFNEEMLRKYKPYLDGSAYKPSNGYRGAGEGYGEKLFPIGMYGSPVMGNSKTEVQLQSNYWVDWFQQNAPDVKYFWYITDEPDSARLVWVKEKADWIHTNTGSGKKLPLFTTTAYKKSMADAIDIWAGFDGVDLNVLPQLQKKGSDHWFYNGNRPRYGSVILEAAAVDFRVDPWIMYKYGINTYFLWHTTAWQHNGQGPKGHLHQNVFQNPLTFINDDMEFGNGDGLLFYPGHMPYYPEEDRGLNRLIPSIRLKNLRRGQQDAAIMKMVEKKVGRQKVLLLINSILPKALSEVDMKDPVPWSQQGDAYERVRLAVLALLKK